MRWISFYVLSVFQGNSSWYVHKEHCQDEKGDLIDENDAKKIVRSASEIYWKNLISTEDKYWLSTTSSTPKE